MADLQDAANKFIEDLIAQNMAGLMGTLTPAGMMKAMAMGQGPQPSGTPTRKEAVLGEPNGEDHPVEIRMATATQEFVVGTVWRDVGGTWKVNDIEIIKGA
jgi:hypothetical protein